MQLAQVCDVCVSTPVPVHVHFRVCVACISRVRALPLPQLVPRGALEGVFQEASLILLGPISTAPVTLSLPSGALAQCLGKHGPRCSSCSWLAWPPLQTWQCSWHD